MNKIIRSALLACGLAGYALAAAAAPAVPVRVVTVEQAPHAGERQISGRVEAIHSVDIRARTEGKIVQRHFQDGQYVNQGDLLFTLDDAQPKAALALAQAELKSAQASLRQAQQLLSRYQQLINNHAIGRNDLDTAQMQRDVAAAAVEQARARIAAQQITLGYTRITSPVSGRVGHSPFHVGSLVNPASGVLVDVVQLDPIRVAFSLDETVFFAKAGQHTDIAALNSLIRSTVCCPAATSPFSSARGSFRSPMIPAAAMQQDAQGFYSWVLTADNTVTMRRLTPAGQQGQQFAVAEGLLPGERVVTEGAQRLRDGAAVQLLN